jgi:hypothetical protein
MSEYIIVGGGWKGKRAKPVLTHLWTGGSWSAAGRGSIPEVFASKRKAMKAAERIADRGYRFKFVATWSDRGALDYADVKYDPRIHR